jgi:hypothetical protein
MCIDLVKWHSVQKDPCNYHQQLWMMCHSVPWKQSKTKRIFWLFFYIRSTFWVKFGSYRECSEIYWACVVSLTVLQWTAHLNYILGAVISTYMYRVSMTVLTRDDGVLSAGVRKLHLGACRAHVWLLYVKNAMVICEFNIRRWGICSFVKNVWYLLCFILLPFAVFVMYRYWGYLCACVGVNCMSVTYLFTYFPYLLTYLIYGAESLRS